MRRNPWIDLVVDERLSRPPVDPWAGYPLVRDVPKWTVPTRQMAEVKR